MYLESLRIEGLFNEFDHIIQFPSPETMVGQPSIVLLHGPNGVGKTTILRMLDGLMRLDFNPFRRVPFKSCVLAFSTNLAISVAPVRRNTTGTPLDVTFDDHSVRLDGRQPGALEDSDRPLVEKFRQAFFTATADLRFDFIDIERLSSQTSSGNRDDLVTSTNLDVYRRTVIDGFDALVTPSSANPKARGRGQREDLATKVRRFIADAQVDYRDFFQTSEPDLFTRILHRVSMPQETTYTRESLQSRLDRLNSQDKELERYGLSTDRWNYISLVEALSQPDNSTARVSVLDVIGAYVETLESRTDERLLLVDRLRTFERVIADFYANKNVRVNSKDGLRIETKHGERLSEAQLSSGEYHLLYLMVAALTTRRRGTILAIDEPEMSMHISWQRKLIRALVECASRAEPQFLFATHSPDIVAGYPEDMVALVRSRGE